MTLLPDFGAASFSDSTAVDNTHYPLIAGTINSYAAGAIDPESGEVEEERNDYFVTFQTYEISGVETVVIRDTAFDDGVLVEDTLDWFAQDDDGNVWYMGEIAVNYNYDDDGNFLGTDFDGSWEAGIDGALPGYIMLADPVVGDSYFQEYYAGVAEDEGEVIATGLTVELDGVTYEDVVKILDTSTLDLTAAAFKYFAPGVGQVLEEEIDITAPEDPELVVSLANQRLVTGAGAVDPADLTFTGDCSTMTVTFLAEESEENGAIGAYLFDPVTGVIGEGRILFADTEDTAAGEQVEVVIPEGMALGLFMVADEDSVGVELEEYLSGGLFFGNLLAGNLTAAYDGDPSTEYAPGAATIFDGIAPVVMDADGNLLPIRPLHAAGNAGGENFLNPVAGVNGRANDAGDAVAGVTVIGFEEKIASDPDYVAEDFNDALIAISSTPLSADDLDTLLEKIDLSRIVGTDDGEMLDGTKDDDQLIALDGADLVWGRKGDDNIEAGDGNDTAYGGKGDDVIDGEDGDDLLKGGKGNDEIAGGEGDDVLAGGSGHDDLDGGDGDDLVRGGAGKDTLRGDEGNDTLKGGLGADRLLGGEDDDEMAGGSGADTFVFDLTALGADVITDFGCGRDVIEIALYLGVESFEGLDISDSCDGTVITLADGSITLLDVAAASLTSSDFVFV